ncbi:hypothetical protein ES703_47772 [subsurface metagenome]
MLLVWALGIPLAVEHSVNGEDVCAILPLALCFPTLLVWALAYPLAFGRKVWSIDFWACLP